MKPSDRSFLTLPLVLKAVGIVALCVCVVAYVLFQARHLITGPIISLAEDVPASTATSSIVVRGTAENIVAITLNGRSIYTTDTGYFEEVVILPRGYTIVTIEAVDRYGTVTRVERGVARIDTH
jgi:hypothetical protein